MHAWVFICVNQGCDFFFIIVHDVVHLSVWFPGKYKKRFVGPVWEIKCFVTEKRTLAEGQLQERKCMCEFLVKYQSVWNLYD